MYSRESRGLEACSLDPTPEGGVGESGLTFFFLCKRERPALLAHNALVSEQMRTSESPVL